MTDKELMQQALEALEEINKLSIGENAICLPAEIDGAMDALRERLAQPEQKPVAWGVFDGPNLHDVNFTEEEAQEMMRLKGDGSVVKPLYTSPQPEQELVCVCGAIWEGQELVSTPPPREWQGLTDEERKSIREWQRIQEELGPVWAPMMLYLYEAIEAKLKEKNT